MEIPTNAYGGLTFFSGLILGGASSLHCAGMCGPIAASLMFGFSKQRSDELRHLMLTQIGRVGGYVACGALLGALGSRIYGAFDHAAAYVMLHWIASGVLLWIGLSMTGIVPPAIAGGCIIGPISTLRDRLARIGGVSGALLSGVVWGFIPCGMVYAALFYAMMTGTAQGGAVFMLSFGVGTMPALIGAALGLSALRRLARKPTMKVAAGLGIAGIAFASVALPAYASHIMCLH